MISHREARHACARRGEDPVPTDRPARPVSSRAKGGTLVTWLIRQFIPTTAFGWTSMLVEALAWPVSGVVIAAMFRAEVRLVLERLVRLKYRNFEAQFHRDLAQAEDLADQTDQAAPKRLLDLPSESRRVLHELDGPSPRPIRPRREP